MNELEKKRQETRLGEEGIFDCCLDGEGETVEKLLVSIKLDWQSDPDRTHAEYLIKSILICNLHAVHVIGCK